MSKNTISIHIASRDLYALVGECRNRSFRWEEKHEISFERAKAALNTATETNHFNVNEKSVHSP